MKKIVTVLGARPQFIKAAVVSRNIAQESSLEEVIVHTGQHFDSNMSDVFFDEMEIPKPKYNLDVNGLSHGAMTGQMLEKIEGVLNIEKPDCVLIYGDTNSTIAGALAAKKMHIKVAHVEAGLRSFNLKMPEEINRILADRISDFLFCPTSTSIDNLLREGYGNLEIKMINSGDVMLDAAIYYSAKARKPKVTLPQKFILCTIHRGENTDDPRILKGIMESLSIISQTTPVVMPLHPRTKATFKRMNYSPASQNLHFIEPVGYFEMIYLLKNCDLVISDSGGLQKEAYFFGKHCLVAREETEWVELVDNGYNFICGTEPEAIISKFNNLLSQTQRQSFSSELYGTGSAGRVIVEELVNSI